MRIKSFAVTNFLGIVKAEAELTAPVTLICGPNESGKSSLREAIRLALLGQSLRVEKKGDFAALIHGEAKRATISVVTEITDGHEEAVTVTITASRSENIPAEKNADPRLLAVWDTEYLTDLDQTALRRALFTLSNVDTSLARIEGMAAEGGMDARTLEEIRPYMKAGFPAAAAEAKSRAAEARAVWKAVTGEVYGTQKAEVWAPAVPPLPGTDSAADLEIAYRGLGKRVAELEVKLTVAQNHESATSSWQGQIAAAEKELAQIAPQDGVISGLSEECNNLSASMAALDAVIAAAKPATAPAVPDAACPACGAALTVSGKSVSAFESGMAVGDPGKYVAAQQELAELQTAHRRASDSLQQAKEKQRTRDRAEASLKSLRANPPAEVGDFNAEEARSTRDALVAQQVTVSAQIHERRAIEQARAALERKATEAAQAHQDVVRWLKAEELCSPNGLPAKILGRAIGPVNALLQRSSQLSGWPAIEITPSIEILYRGIPLALNSESAHWRARAMLVHAIAELHGVKTIVLDRMDVLQTSARAELVKWAQAIHADKGIQFLVFATLKEPPAMPGVNSLWLEGGKIGQAQ